MTPDCDWIMTPETGDHDHGYTRILQQSPPPEQAVSSKTKPKMKEEKAAAAATTKKLLDESRAVAGGAVAHAGAHGVSAQGSDGGDGRLLRIPGQRH